MMKLLYPDRQGIGLRMGNRRNSDDQTNDPHHREPDPGRRTGGAACLRKSESSAVAGRPEQFAEAAKHVRNPRRRSAEPFRNWRPASSIHPDLDSRPEAAVEI